MEIDAEHSAVGPKAEGIPISVLATGEVIRSPRINTTTMLTTLSALPGQTLVLGGLKAKDESGQTKEVVIILTPRVLWEDDEAEPPTK
jgi:type II secretory pathway component GspD/PulD (secretin)